MTFDSAHMKDAHLAILFADATGCVELFEAKGDKEAVKVIKACTNLMRSIAIAEGGRPVKEIGDEVMVAFNRADDAVNAAVAIQEHLESSEPVRGVQLTVKIGIEAGEVMVTLGDDDVFGKTVNMAARLVGLAQANQILTSRQTYEQLSPSLQWKMHSLGRVPVKGMPERIELFDVEWQQHATEERTELAPGESSFRLPELSVELVLGEEIRTLAPGDNLTFGKSSRCDLTIRCEYTSREHASIAWQHGKCYLADRSRNGTYVAPEGERARRVHLDRLELRGSGRISFGIQPDSAAEHVLSYRCEFSDSVPQP